MVKVNCSKRSARIKPFHVMNILARAKELEQQGRSIIHLEVGEPDFPTPDPIIAAGIEALKTAKTHYTPAIGLPALRQAISDNYQRRFNIKVEARRIIVTPGASGALQLALLTLLDADETVLLSDPGYPCNKNIAQILASKVISVPVDAVDNYQLSAKHINESWQDSTRVAMVASPSNPTGTLMSPSQFSALMKAVKEKQGTLIVDEIYQGLVYDVSESTVLSITNECADNCFVINSFSKYFGMTGWRLGWMVVPSAFVDVIDRISQNIFLAPSTMAQHAALVALEDSTEMILQQRCDEFKARRDYLLPALEALGFKIMVQPQGAFYLYAQCDAFTDDSFSWTQKLLEEQGVAITPGIDFGEHEAKRYCRFAYTQPVGVLEKAVARIKIFIEQGIKVE